MFEITLTTRDGKTCSQRSPEHYRGGPRNPLTWDELCDKFHDCAQSVLDEAARTRFIEGIDRLETASDLTAILDAVSA